VRVFPSIYPPNQDFYPQWTSISFSNGWPKVIFLVIC